MRQVL